MTSKQRVMNRLAGKPVDRIPNFSILMGFSARYCGMTVADYCKSYQSLVPANITTARDFGLDILSTMSDAYRETADYGAELIFPTDSYPHCRRHFIEEPDDIKKLSLYDPYERERMKDRIYAVAEFKKQCGDEYPIMGWVEGAIAEASDLCGLSELALMFYDDPEAVGEMLEICCEQAILLAKEQIKAGADIIGVGDAAVSVLGPALYAEYGYQFEKRLFEEIHRAGAIGRLHICGNIAPELELLATVGADIIDVDWMVDLREAEQKLKGVAVCGNYDPVTVLLQGTPADVEKAVLKAVEEGGERSFNMAGCEVPIFTPDENLLAVHRTLVKAGAR
ncbi:MAG: uroporphyrinogen decarboxylase family protein [Clostridia bacterium]|nr:uroporphyrinogen decarboxylase family protein [Clostridia bacterium]